MFQVNSQNKNQQKISPGVQSQLKGASYASLQTSQPQQPNQNNLFYNMPPSSTNSSNKQTQLNAGKSMRSAQSINANAQASWKSPANSQQVTKMHFLNSKPSNFSGINTNFRSNASSISTPNAGNASVNAGTANSANVTIPIPSCIREVWSFNLESEIAYLRDLVERYPYVALDTEFPGVVLRPIGQFKTINDYHYQTLRTNVDSLKLIQLGLTFTNKRGEFPPEVCTWQFNFAFSLDDDMYAQDSIDLLTSAGIDFKKFEEYGIDPFCFAELLISSGLVLNEEVHWISFHSSYDFGFLLKLMTCIPLPTDETEFFQILHIFFPTTFDVKYIMKKGGLGAMKGLQETAEELKIPIIGQQHQAGPDSLLTLRLFLEMRARHFNNNLDSSFNGCLYGLGYSGLHLSSQIPMPAISTPAITANSSPYKSPTFTNKTPSVHASPFHYNRK